MNVCMRVCVLGVRVNASVSELEKILWRIVCVRKF